MMIKVNIKDNGIYMMQDDIGGMMYVFPNFSNSFGNTIQSKLILDMNDIQTIIITMMGESGSVSDKIAKVIGEMPMELLSLPGYSDFVYESCIKHLN